MDPDRSIAIPRERVSTPGKAFAENRGAPRGSPVPAGGPSARATTSRASWAGPRTSITPVRRLEPQDQSAGPGAVRKDHPVLDVACHARPPFRAGERGGAPPAWRRSATISPARSTCRVTESPTGSRIAASAATARPRLRSAAPAAPGAPTSPPCRRRRARPPHEARQKAPQRGNLAAVHQDGLVLAA